MRVELNPGIPGGRWAQLRPITGQDELALDPGVPDAGNALLRRLLMQAPGSAVGPETLPSLTACDRDRLLAAVYADCYGDRIDSASTCTNCREPFHLDLSLADLVLALGGKPPADVTGPDEDGRYRAASGARFRLPTVGDLETVAGEPPDRAEALLQAACCPDVDEVSLDGIFDAMSQLAPVLDIDVGTRCPACQHMQSVRFNVGAFLVRAIARERRFLPREVHQLAMAYGWNLGEILALSREDRRAFVRIVDAEPRRGGRR